MGFFRKNKEKEEFNFKDAIIIVGKYLNNPDYNQYYGVLGELINKIEELEKDETENQEVLRLLNFLKDTPVGRENSFTVLLSYFSY